MEDEVSEVLPVRYSVLIRLCVVYECSEEDQRPRLRLELTLGDARCPEERLRAMFHDVDQLAIASHALWGFNVVRITSIAVRQWESARYRVSEEENGNFSFYCKGFDVRLETPELA